MFGIRFKWEGGSVAKAVNLKLYQRAIISQNNTTALAIKVVKI